MSFTTEYNQSRRNNKVGREALCLDSHRILA